MPATPKLAIPYPALPDPADVPTDTGELATRIDDLAGVAGGLATLDTGGKVPTSQLPPAPAAIPPTVVDAKGDLVGATADDTPARVPKASADGQVLTSDNAQATGVKWAPPAAGIPATIIDAKGDLIAGLANDSPGRLPPGTDGQVLTVDSTQAPGLKWGPPAAGSGIPPAIVDAKGDLIAASGPDTVARLPVGADGLALVADAASALGLKWAAPPAGLPPTTGHEGDFLKVVGGSPAWAVAAFVALAAYVAKGDLLVASGPGAPVRLPVGADGQGLVADAASPGGVKWAAVAAGGGVDYENVWDPATAYQAGDVVVFNGVNYLAVNPSTGQTPTFTGGSDIGTALPSSPVDGQMFTLVDSLVAPTYAWRLRYVATKASNRWVFLGGSSLYAEVVTNETGAQTAYGNLATLGPSIALPVAGDYMLEHGADLRTSGAGGTIVFMSYDIGATGAVDADAISFIQPSGAFRASLMRARRKTFGAVTLLAKYRTTATDVQAQNRWIRATPIAIGG